MRRNVVAFDDEALIGWLLELIEEPAAGFLAFVAEAAILADPEEYAILRPALWLLKQRNIRLPVTPSTISRYRPSPSLQASRFFGPKEKHR